MALGRVVPPLRAIAASSAREGEKVWNVRAWNRFLFTKSHGGVRRPTVSASAPRFWAAGRRYRQPEPPGTRARLRLIEKIQGMFGIITPGQGGI